jgi:DNA polymerase-3 subunit alpha
MSAGFVHLHVHSQFSFMDGAAPLPALVTRAAELEMPALALTDHQGMSGAIRFYKACHAVGIRPIVGCEVVVETAGILGGEADLPPERRLLLPARGLGARRLRGTTSRCSAETSRATATCAGCSRGRICAGRMSRAS